MIGAVFGIERIKIDDRSASCSGPIPRIIRQYEAVTKRFPATEFDVLVVVEGKTLLARDNLEKMRDLVTDLQLVEGTRGLIFAVLGAPGAGARQDCRRRCSRRTAGRRRLRQVHRDRQNQRDHPRQAVVRKTARWR